MSVSLDVGRKLLSKLVAAEVEVLLEVVLLPMFWNGMSGKSLLSESGGFGKAGTEGLTTGSSQSRLMEADRLTLSILLLSELNDRCGGEGDLLKGMCRRLYGNSTGATEGPECVAVMCSRSAGF